MKFLLNSCRTELSNFELLNPLLHMVLGFTIWKACALIVLFSRSSSRESKHLLHAGYVSIQLKLVPTSGLLGANSGL